MATWPIIIDDDGSGTSGTPTDYALFQQIKTYIDQQTATGHVTLVPAGTVIDWDPPGAAAAYFWTLTPTAPCTITGIKGAADGMAHVLSNESIHAVTIAHASPSSASGNQFICPTGVNVVLQVYETLTVRWSSSLGYWQVLGLKRT